MEQLSLRFPVIMLPVLNHKWGFVESSYHILLLLSGPPGMSWWLKSVPQWVGVNISDHYLPYSASLCRETKGLMYQGPWNPPQLDSGTLAGWSWDVTPPASAAPALRASISSYVNFTPCEVLPTLNYLEKNALKKRKDNSQQAQSKEMLCTSSCSVLYSGDRVSSSWKVQSQPLPVTERTLPQPWENWGWIFCTYQDSLVLRVLLSCSWGESSSVFLFINQSFKNNIEKLLPVGT